MLPATLVIYEAKSKWMNNHHLYALILLQIFYDKTTYLSSCCYFKTIMTYFYLQSCSMCTNEIACNLFRRYLMFRNALQFRSSIALILFCAVINGTCTHVCVFVLYNLIISSVNILFHLNYWLEMIWRNDSEDFWAKVYCSTQSIFVFM